MNGMRKFFGLVLVALALAAFALPAAAQKVYQLNLSSSPSPLNNGLAGTVTATMNNISADQGNSTIKSFKLSAANGITITAPASGALVNLGNGYTATIQNNGNSIYVSNVNIPLKPFGTPLQLTMAVGVSCDATGGAWTIQGPWNGGMFTGQTFAQQPPSNLTTNVTGACTYSTTFLNQPKKTFAGYPITDTAFDNPHGNPIKVQLTVNNGVPPTTLVTLTSACSLSGNSASTNGSGIATFSNLKVTAAATGCTLSASFGTSSATSNAFDIKQSDGVLACASTGAADAPIMGNLDPLDPTPPTGNADWGMVRGLNADGTCGPQTPFSFNLDAGTQTFTFTEDSLGQQTSVEYVILWPLVNKDADAWSGKQPCVTYGTVGNDPPVFTPDATYGCIGDYIPAPLCNSTNVDAYNAVMPDIPNVQPYAGSAFTQFKPTSVTGLKAKVCVAQQGVTPISATQVQYWTKFIDQTDTSGKMP